MQPKSTKMPSSNSMDITLALDDNAKKKGLNYTLIQANVCKEKKKNKNTKMPWRKL